MTAHIENLINELIKLEKKWYFLPHLLHGKVVKKRLEIEKEIAKEKLDSLENLEMLLEIPCFSDVVQEIKENGFIGDLKVFKKTDDYHNNYNWQCREIMIRHAEMDISDYLFREYLKKLITFDRIKECLSEPPYDSTNKKMVELLDQISDVKSLLGFQPDAYEFLIADKIRPFLQNPEISHHNVVTYDELFKNRQKELNIKLEVANTFRKRNYHNHCWNCGHTIDGASAQVCPKCKTYYICPHCGKCKCGYDLNKAKKEIYKPY